MASDRVMFSEDSAVMSPESVQTTSKVESGGTDYSTTNVQVQNVD